MGNLDKRLEEILLELADSVNSSSDKLWERHIIPIAQEAIKQLLKEAELNGRYDELEKARWILQKHNPQNTLADVFTALNHRSTEIAAQLKALKEGTKSL